MLSTVVRELLKITHIQLLVCINPPLKIVPRNTQFTPITWVIFAKNPVVLGSYLAFSPNESIFLWPVCKDLCFQQPIYYSQLEKVLRDWLTHCWFCLFITFIDSSKNIELPYTLNDSTVVRCITSISHFNVCFYRFDAEDGCYTSFVTVSESLFCSCSQQ